METSVILSRKMGEFSVTQRTTDGYFDANALLSQWNAEKNNPQRKMETFITAANTGEFCSALNDELSQNADNQHRANLPKGDNQLVIKSKGRMTMHGKTSDKVWMHPYLFIKFAMWINPRFEVKVIKFVYDELIKQRNDAGDAYREMSAAIAKIAQKKDLVVSISKVAEAVNYVAFNEHETAIRNRKGESEMKILVEIEKQVTLLINVGFLKDMDSTIGYLRSEWKQRHVKTPQLFA